MSAFQYESCSEGESGVNTKLNHVQDWLELAHNANWSVGKLAKSCGVSVRTLEGHFLRTNGKTPKVWLSEQRQRIAMELLRNGASVKQTAARLNYKYANHFSREFKNHWGHCPTQINLSNSETKLRVLV